MLRFKHIRRQRKDWIGSGATKDGRTKIRTKRILYRAEQGGKSYVLEVMMTTIHSSTGNKHERKHHRLIYLETAHTRTMGTSFEPHELAAYKRAIARHPEEVIAIATERGRAWATEKIARATALEAMVLEGATIDEIVASPLANPTWTPWAVERLTKMIKESPEQWAMLKDPEYMFRPSLPPLQEIRSL